MSSGFINGAKLVRDSDGNKGVGLMMVACGGAFLINLVLEIILLIRVSVMRKLPGKLAQVTYRWCGSLHES